MEREASPVIGLMDSKRIKHLYESSNPVNEDMLRIVPTPFKVIKFSNFLKDELFLGELCKDISGMIYHRRENDLYSLNQTTELAEVKTPSVQKFFSLLMKEMLPLLGEIMNIQFNDKLSAAASSYQYRDVLLCHDDKCNDRSVAFVFYLSESESQDGGEFQMFDHDENGQPTSVSVSIPAEKNSFLCFEVGNYSYHQVAEITNPDFKRLSINGWFHSDAALKLEDLPYIEPMPDLQEQVVLQGFILLGEFLNLTYCTPSNLIQLRKVFEDKSQILIHNFLKPKFYKACAKAMKKDSICWKHVGPANRRNYEIAVESSLPKILQTLSNLLKSSLFISYFRNTSGLSLEPFGGTAKTYTGLVFEIQRWSSGSYSMVTDNDEFFNKFGLDVYLFFCTKAYDRNKSQTGGFTSYLATDDSDDDKELLMIEPEDNALCMVYRTDDTVRFTKYINCTLKNPYYCISATYYEPTEAA